MVMTPLPARMGRTCSSAARGWTRSPAARAPTSSAEATATTCSRVAPATTCSSPSAGTTRWPAARRPTVQRRHRRRHEHRPRHRRRATRGTAAKPGSVEGELDVSRGPGWSAARRPRGRGRAPRRAPGERAARLGLRSPTRAESARPSHEGRAPSRAGARPSSAALARSPANAAVSPRAAAASARLTRIPASPSCCRCTGPSPGPRPSGPPRGHRGRGLHPSHAWKRRAPHLSIHDDRDLIAALEDLASLGVAALSVIGVTEDPRARHNTCAGAGLLCALDACLSDRDCLLEVAVS